jgi:Na+/proline symporter
LLIAVILCATMSATAATLNALGSTTAVDFYRPFIMPNASDRHYVVATQILTVAWGLVAIGVASFASLVENLIEAGNILGSIFYGTILGLFVVAFFVRQVRGSAVFFAALIAQTLVLLMFWKLSISYLWYNVIGCLAVLVFSLLLERTLFADRAAT